MQSYSLSVEKRTVTGKKVAELRAKKMMPAVVYGHGTQAQNVSVPYIVFEKAYKAAGESSLVDLTVEGSAPVKVLIHDVQRDPLSYAFTHADFYQVRMNEKLTTMIQLEFIGESPAVKSLGGIFVKNLDELEVRCLPGDLVHEIQVDISGLATLEDRITVADIKVPKGMEILNDPEDAVATVAEPISEAEFAALDEKVEENVEAVKVEEKGKKEEE